MCTRLSLMSRSTSFTLQRLNAQTWLASAVVVTMLIDTGRFCGNHRGCRLSIVWRGSRICSIHMARFSGVIGGTTPLRPWPSGGRPCTPSTRISSAFESFPQAPAVTLTTATALHHSMSLICCEGIHDTPATLSQALAPCLFSIDLHTVWQFSVITHFLLLLLSGILFLMTSGVPN